MAGRGRPTVEMAKRSRFTLCGCNGLKDSLHAVRGGFYGVLAAEDTRAGVRPGGRGTAGSLSAADEWAAMSHRIDGARPPPRAAPAAPPRGRCAAAAAHPLPARCRPPVHDPSPLTWEREGTNKSLMSNRRNPMMSSNNRQCWPNQSVDLKFLLNEVKFNLNIYNLKVSL